MCQKCVDEGTMKQEDLDDNTLGFKQAGEVFTSMVALIRKHVTSKSDIPRVLLAVNMTVELAKNTAISPPELAQMLFEAMGIKGVVVANASSRATRTILDKLAEEEDRIAEEDKDEAIH